MIGAVRLPRQRRFQVEESLDELAALVAAAGAEVADRVMQERASPSPATYFGKGKVEEIGALMRERGANLFVSDDALSPVQERNISEATGLKVIDRTALILDIFAQRARTAEGKLQVELAQLMYLMPRLVGQWKHLERLGGGIGTRGPGETQLESDRRIIQRRVKRIRADLEGVQVHRRLQRKGRRRGGVPVVALVGYTNAGKTTLMNRLTGANLHAANQLFVTLDPAARLVQPGGAWGAMSGPAHLQSKPAMSGPAHLQSKPAMSGPAHYNPMRKPFILTDTVGFIRKLPHELVAAFRATLEELAEADVLLHVVDASQAALEEQMAAVESLLGELGVSERPTILVLNKMDRVESARSLDTLMASRPRVVAVSAVTGKGIESLLAAIDGALSSAPAVAAAEPG